MAQQIINIGAAPNDFTGDPLRTGATKANDNFTELYANSVSCYAELNSLQTQTFLVSTPTPISLDNQNEVEFITHSTVTNNSEMTIDVAGVYKFGIELQLLRTTGGGINIFNCWVQKDSGGSFVNLPNSNIKVNIATSARTFVSPLTTTVRLNVNDKIRFMASTDDVDVVLSYTAAGGGIPATPSVIVNVIKIGS